MISPEGLLHRVPFSALLPKRSVVYMPSGSTYRVLRDAAPVKGKGIVAFGGPDYSHSNLPSLPFAGEEAKAIGSVVLTGAKVTRSAVTQHLRRVKPWRAIHFACHGKIDEDRPLFSGLELSPENPEDTALLTGLDLLTTRLHTEMAVLSACQTGLGRDYGGEGLLGLTRSFLLAGAPRVIASLWKVDDAATKALMLKFYELWSPTGKGPRMPAGEALRRAQDHVRSQAKWRHPYYWGAWVLWGLPD